MGGHHILFGLLFCLWRGYAAGSTQDPWILIESIIYTFGFIHFGLVIAETWMPSAAIAANGVVVYDPVKARRKITASYVLASCLIVAIALAVYHYR